MEHNLTNEKNNSKREKPNHGPLKCDKCPSTFIAKYDLKRHLLTHTKVRPFACDFCPKSFKEKTYLRLHEERKHCIGNYKCTQCSMVFQDVYRYHDHETYAHKSKLKCTYCWRKFLLPKFKEEHEKNKHPEEYALDTDKRNSSEPMKLSNSCTKEQDQCPSIQKNGSPVSPTSKLYFKCIICTEHFKNRNDQMKHYKSLHSEAFTSLYMECNICDKIIRKKTYYYHMKAHNGEFNYNCTICVYKTVYQKNLNDHMRKHLDVKTGNLKRWKWNTESTKMCSVCKMEFKLNAQARLCEKRHKGIRDVECKDCGKKFFSGLQLKSHKHTVHKVHKCSFCGHIALTTRLLLQHKRLFHEYKTRKTNAETNISVMCDQCGIFCKSKAHLTLHIRNHKQEKLNLPLKKAYLCEYCSYQGNSQKDIWQHCMQVHSSNMYKCELCSFVTNIPIRKLFHMSEHGERIDRQESYFKCKMKRHIEEIDSASNFECFLCRYSCSTSKLIEEHIRTHKVFLGKFGKFRGNYFDYTAQKRRWDGLFGTPNQGKRKYRTIKEIIVKDLSIGVSLGVFCLDPDPEPKSESSKPNELPIKNELEDNDVEITDDFMSLTSDVPVAEDDLGIDDDIIPLKSEIAATGLCPKDFNNKVNNTVHKSTSVSCTETSIANEETKKGAIKKTGNVLPVNSSSQTVESDPTSKCENNSQMSVLSSKLKSIDGEVFLSLQDICSLDSSSLTKELFQKLLKQIDKSS